MYIGVDIGGTNTKIGIISKLGRVIANLSFKTNIPKAPEVLAKEIQQKIDEILKQESMTLNDVEGIGIGFPGVVNMDGVVVQSVNLGWKNVDFKSYFEGYINKPVVVGNDADCAMIAEWKFGSAKGSKNAILVTLGTGIGSGIILDGKLFRGAHGMGSECGHMVIKFDGEQCNCGNRGCWERYASAKALSRRTEQVAKENPQSIINDIMRRFNNKASAHTSFEAAKKGDKVAKALVDEYIDYVVCGLINLTQIFHPEIFVLGGGVAKEGPAFIKMVDAKLNEFIKKNNFEPTVAVKHPVLENSAGIVGAACLAMDI